MSILTLKFFESESCSVMSDSLQTHGLHGPWNSPGQNAGVDSLSLLQEIFLTQGLNLVLPHCRWILYQLKHQGSPRILEWAAYPFTSRSFQPRNQPGSSALRVNSLLTELPEKPLKFFEQLLNCFLPRMGIVRLQGLASKSCIFYQLFSRIVESAEIYNNSNQVSTHSETQEKHEYILISLLAICISAFYTVIKKSFFFKIHLTVYTSHFMNGGFQLDDYSLLVCVF